MEPQQLWPESLSLPHAVISAENHIYLISLLDLKYIYIYINLEFETYTLLGCIIAQTETARRR